MRFIGCGRRVRLVLACALSLAVLGATSAAHGKWSSGVVAKREESGLAIKGFQPQMTASNCLTVKGRDARDRLICKTFWAAEGQRMTSISEVTVARKAGTPSYEFKPIVEAREMSEARGANVVDCERAALRLFEIKSITPGSAPGLVAFDASYAGRATVERLCGRQAGHRLRGRDRGVATVAAGDVEISTLQLDIHRGAVAMPGGRPVQ